MTDSRSPSDTSIAFWLALFLFGVYLLSFSGRITSSDGLSMFAVTESAVKRGDVSTDQMWTFFGAKSAPAPDGEAYSKYGYGTSLLAAPLYALALYVPFFGLMQLTVLSSALAMACAGAFVYLTARRLKFSVAVALATTLLFGLATPAWVYAKEFWSEAFATATLCAAFYFLLAYRQQRGLHDCAIAGICLGLAIAVRTTNILLLPLYVWYAFVNLGEKGGEHKGKGEHAASPLQVDWRGVFWFAIPVSGFVLAILFYNAVRFGNVFTTGYRADETFNNNILLGAYGLLFSPGKGLFVYAPILAALPFGAWQFYKHHKREFVFVSLLSTFYV
ncbi:MAG: glycosyltransferase family 39 protein [Chloroflexi bacterium]|nr:glycosyltransferase family 39 protein [Chloroflexota bacterium]